MLKRIVAVGIFAGATALMFVGCGDNSGSCGADTDCKGDRVCNGGECVFPDGGNNGGGNNTTANSNPNSNPNSTTTVSCADACPTKFEECAPQASQDEIDQNCAFACANLSDAEVQCLADADCATLEEVVTGGAGSICPANSNTGQNSNSNGNTGTDSDEGGDCMCDEHPQTMDDSVHGYCEGTENGCIYNFPSDEPQLGCFYVYRTGEGTCHYSCNKDDRGTQGSCPDGYTCVDSGLEDVTGETWSYCD